MSKKRYSNFDILRFVAAIFVIFGHMAYLMGGVPTLILNQSVSTIGVKLLFLLSGFFIYKSCISSIDKFGTIQGLLLYFIKRVLRIFPLFIAVVVLTIFLGTLFTTLSTTEYLTSRETWSYLKNLILYPIYSLPGVFANNYYPNAVNGSLWTMPVEIAMYVVVPILCIALNKIRVQNEISILILIVITLLLFIGAHFYSAKNTVFVLYGTEWISAAVILPYYLTGIIFAKINNIHSIVNLPLSALFLLFVPLIDNYYFSELLFLILFSWFVFSFGYSEDIKCSYLFSKYELSYGIYLWSFPIQQGLVNISLNKYFNENLILALSLLLSVGFSFTTLMSVERPSENLSKAIVAKLKSYF